MSNHYSLIFSQILLFSTSIYCIKANLELICPSPVLNINFSLSGLYALSTGIQYLFPEIKNLEKIEDVIIFLIASIALPCLMVDIWKKYEIVSENLSYVHLYLGIVLALTELIVGIDDESFDVIVGINVLALLVLSLMYSDLYSMCCSLLFIMGYFGCRQNLSSDARVKLDDTFNYCLTGFTLCALLSRQKMGSRVIASNIVLTMVTVGSIAKSYEWDIDDHYAAFHYASLIAATTYAIMGLTTSLIDENCHEIAAALNEFSVNLIPSVVLPFFVTEVWLKNNISTDEAAYAFAVAGAFTEVLLFLEVLNQTLLDALILIETAALAEAGHRIDDQYVMAAAGCFAGAHLLSSYCHRQSCRRCRDEKVPPSYLYNCLLAGYIYCVLMSNACIKTA